MQLDTNAPWNTLSIYKVIYEKPEALCRAQGSAVDADDPDLESEKEKSQPSM